MATLNLESFLKMNPMNISVSKIGMRKPEQKKKNRAEVLGIVNDNPSITRQKISKLTELATSTVYRLIVDLEKSLCISKELGSGKTKYGNEFFTATDKGKLNHKLNLKEKSNG